MGEHIDVMVSTLTAERQRLGLSLRAVARRSDVSTSCVHSWEHGTRNPSLSNLRAWAQALGFHLTLERRHGAVIGEDGLVPGPGGQRLKPAEDPWPAVNARRQQEGSA